MVALWAPSTCGQRLTEPTKLPAALPAAPALPLTLQPRLPSPALPHLPKSSQTHHGQILSSSSYASWGRDVMISSELLSTFHQSTSP